MLKTINTIGEFLQAMIRAAEPLGRFSRTLKQNLIFARAYASECHAEHSKNMLAVRFFAARFCTSPAD
jgi:hypothetical protein